VGRWGCLVHSGRASIYRAGSIELFVRIGSCRELPQRWVADLAQVAKKIATQSIECVPRGVGRIESVNPIEPIGPLAHKRHTSSWVLIEWTHVVPRATIPSDASAAVPFPSVRRVPALGSAENVCSRGGFVTCWLPAFCRESGFQGFGSPASRSEGGLWPALLDWGTLSDQSVFRHAGSGDRCGCSARLQSGFAGDSFLFESIHAGRLLDVP
jgi:hypothetical protein